MLPLPCWAVSVVLYWAPSKVVRPTLGVWRDCRGTSEGIPLAAACAAAPAGNRLTARVYLCSLQFEKAYFEFETQLEDFKPLVGEELYTDTLHQIMVQVALQNLRGGS